MTTDQTISLLQQFHLFKGFNSQEMQEIAHHATEKIFPTHTIILSQDHPAQNVLFIYKGLICIYIMNPDGKIIPIRTKGPLYISGEINIVDNERSATIETLQETHALAISVEHCRKLVLTYPHFGYELLKIIVEKLRAANRQTEYYFSASLKDRTWTIVQDLATYFPDRTIPLSQEELANIIGATRARITEVLQELKHENFIIIAHKQIKVL